MPLYTLQLSNEGIQRINISNPWKQASIVRLLITSQDLQRGLLDTLQVSRYLVLRLFARYWQSGWPLHPAGQTVPACRI